MAMTLTYTLPVTRLPLASSQFVSAQFNPQAGLWTVNYTESDGTTVQSTKQVVMAAAAVDAAAGATVQAKILNALSTTIGRAGTVA